MTQGRPGLRVRAHVALEGRVHVSRGAAGHDGRHVAALRPGPGLVLQSRDLVEDVGEGLVLRAPVQEVVPVVAARNLLLAVDDAETEHSIHKE